MSSSKVDTLIVGAGPAAMGVLDAATVHPLPELGRICMATAPGMVGSGSLSHYSIPSDTPGAVFVEVAAIGMAAEPGLGPRRVSELVAACSTAHPVPLDKAAELLTFGATQRLRHLSDPPVSFLAPATVSRLDRCASGGHRVVADTADGLHEIFARNVVLGLGGRPWAPSTLTVALTAAGHNVAHSDDVLRGSLPKIAEAQSISIIGGSHSAFACAGALLARDADHQLGDGTIRVLHRGPIRMTYPDVAAAFADGAAVTEGDVCPLTSRVHRFAGLRGESARLWKLARDGRDRRIELIRTDDPVTAAGLRGGSDVVITATGYVNRAIDLVGELFEKESLCSADDIKPRPRLDRMGRLVDGSGRTVDGLYCVGLGAGHRRPAGSGGESSFGGSVDGVWYYRHVVGPAVVASIAATRAANLGAALSTGSHP